MCSVYLRQGAPPHYSFILLPLYVLSLSTPPLPISFSIDILSRSDILTETVSRVLCVCSPARRSCALRRVQLEGWQLPPSLPAYRPTESTLEDAKALRAAQSNLDAAVQDLSVSRRKLLLLSRPARSAAGGAACEPRPRQGRASGFAPSSLASAGSDGAAARSPVRRAQERNLKEGARVAISQTGDASLTGDPASCGDALSLIAAAGDAVNGAVRAAMHSLDQLQAGSSSASPATSSQFTPAALCPPTALIWGYSPSSGWHAQHGLGSGGGSTNSAAAKASAAALPSAPTLSTLGSREAHFFGPVVNITTATGATTAPGGNIFSADSRQRTLDCYRARFPPRPQTAVLTALRHEQPSPQGSPASQSQLRAGKLELTSQTHTHARVGMPLQRSRSAAALVPTKAALLTPARARPHTAASLGASAGLRPSSSSSGSGFLVRSLSVRLSETARLLTPPASTLVSSPSRPRPRWLSTWS